MFEKKCSNCKWIIPKDEFLSDESIKIKIEGKITKIIYQGKEFKIEKGTYCSFECFLEKIARKLGIEE